MNASGSSPVPSTRVLERRLRASLGAEWEIVERSTEPCRSSFPAEIVTCRIDGASLRLFCKYSPYRGARLPSSHVAHGHRHGVSYEARVYRAVLQPLQMTTPRLYGLQVGSGACAWLATEYLEDAMQIGSVPGALSDAAAWIGRFHCANERRLEERSLRFLVSYSKAYYGGWLRRTLAAARSYRDELASFEQLERAAAEAIAVLMGAPQTVIHGEFYPSNVLWRDGIVHPVDWETTAIAAGELDVACLTEHWGEDFEERCERAYMDARWPDGCEVAAFRRRMAAARLCMVLRWTGVRDALTESADRAYYFDRLDEAIRRYNAVSSVGTHTFSAGESFTEVSA